MKRDGRHIARTVFRSINFTKGEYLSSSPLCTLTPVIGLVLKRWVLGMESLHREQSQPVQHGDPTEAAQLPPGPAQGTLLLSRWPNFG